MNGRRVMAAGAAVFLLAAGGPASAVTNDTGLGIRLLDAPVARQGDPRALVYIVDHVAPGATFTRHLEVSNGTSNVRQVEVYPDAASIGTGAFTVAAGHAVNELTTWITVSPTSIELAPHETRTVTATVSVPKDASPGERYGVILAEFRAAPAQGIRGASRVGIRTYLSVGPGGEPASNFTVDSLTAGRDAAGVPVVTASVHNTGGRALDMRGTLTLAHGPGGLSAGPFVVKLGSTLAPGDTEPVSVALDKALPAGPWEARIDLQSGLLQRAATATITFPDTAGTSAPPVQAKAVPLVKNFPVVATLAGALLLLLLVLLLLLWRFGALARRRDKSADR